CCRTARIDRMRCWFMPMRPVTPFMMMPRRRSAIVGSPSAACSCDRRGRHRRPVRLGVAGEARPAKVGGVDHAADDTQAYPPALQPVEMRMTRGEPRRLVLV